MYEGEGGLIGWGRDIVPPWSMVAIDGWQCRVFYRAKQIV